MPVGIKLCELLWDNPQGRTHELVCHEPKRLADAESIVSDRVGFIRPDLSSILVRLSRWLGRFHHGGAALGGELRN